jgi:uncharacterized protein (DUF2141 family)
MRKRLLTIILSALITIGGTSMVVSAKENVSNTKSKFTYEAANTKISLADKKQLKAKSNVALHEEWTIELPEEVKTEDISAAVVQKQEEFIPVKVTLTGENEIKIRPVIGYEGNSEYTLKVFLKEGMEYNMNFTTTAEPRMADAEPNNEFLNGSIINAGETIIGNIENEDRIDFYRVDLSKDGILNIDAIHKEGKEIELYLYGKDGDNQKALVELWTGKNSVRHISKGLAAGTYYIKVYSEESGEYEIKTNFESFKKANDKENNDNYIKASEIKLNSEITGHIASFLDNTQQDKVDWYKISLKEDGILNIKSTHCKGQEIELHLYGKDGDNQDPIQSQWTGNNSIREISASLVEGTYYIKVNSENSGDYQLKNEFIKASLKNDTEDNSMYMDAEELKLNSKVTGHIAHINEYCNIDKSDWYKLDIKKRGKLKLDVEHTGGQEVELYLYGEDGDNQDPMQGQWTGNNSVRHIEQQLSPGTYYVKIYSENSGNYKLKNSFK